MFDSGLGQLCWILVRIVTRDGLTSITRTEPAMSPT